jgi:AraC-like DNA-binding protein
VIFGCLLNVMPRHDYWTFLLDRTRRSAPLSWRHGMRHSIGRDFYCATHSHPDLEIVHHPSGRGVTRLGSGREIAFREGDTIIYAPSVPHSQAMERPGQDWCVQITGLPAPKGGDQAEALHVPARATNAFLRDIELLSVMHARPTPVERAILNLRASALLMELVHFVCQVRADADLPVTERHVRKAEHYIDEHFSEISSLREVAEAVGIGYDHLRHSFKKQRGKSLVRHLCEVRIERAKALLDHSRLPLKQIAAMCGFREEYYFSAVFHKFTRLAPGRYRSRPGGLGYPAVDVRPSPGTI